MSSGGATLGGSSRLLRLDPRALPARFAATDVATGEESREIELSRERVMVRRTVAGIRMALSVPLATYVGVALRPFTADGVDLFAITLEHRDPNLSVPLHLGRDGEGVVEEWQRWAEVLRLPLYIGGLDGALHDPFARAPRLRARAPCPRRRRRNAVHARRPRSALRRRLGRLSPARVHRGEREIIARE